MKVNKILAVAINEYDHPDLNRIENCEADVRAILSVLTSKYSFDDITVLYTKEETTRNNLYQNLYDYFINSTSEDHILFIYAGHGEYHSKLGKAYWQPSDADPKSVTTWLPLREVLDFVKVSEASHISMIVDSCFAGAVFGPPTRGGGLEALTSKKARQALTSGGVERVSDGKKGGNSPFASAVIKVLTRNESRFMTFESFGQGVIMEFDPKATQGPMYGSLSDVGHDGGTFVFSLKESELKEADHQNINDYIKGQLRNLFLPIPTEVVEDLQTIAKIRQEKTLVVRRQLYQEAAILRDREKELEKHVRARIVQIISNRTQSIVDDIRAKDAIRFKILDKEVSRFLAAGRSRTREFERIMKSMSPEQRPIELAYEVVQSAFEQLGEPVSDLLIKNQEHLYLKYSEGIWAFYEFVLHLIGGCSNALSDKVIQRLKEVLLEVYQLECAIQTGSLRGTIKERKVLAELDRKMLEWLDGRFY